MNTGELDGRRANQLRAIEPLNEAAAAFVVQFGYLWQWLEEGPEGIGPLPWPFEDVLTDVIDGVRREFRRFVEAGERAFEDLDKAEDEDAAPRRSLEEVRQSVEEAEAWFDQCFEPDEASDD